MSVQEMHNQDVIEFLLEHTEKFRVIFADPPDNIGLKYRESNDIMPNYYAWMGTWMNLALIRSKCLWISYYHEHDIFIKSFIGTCGKRSRQFIWRFNFGQYRDNDWPNGYRPIVCIYDRDFKFNFDRIRVPSMRETIYHDSRASGPRVPDDVWEFPRVTGNCSERFSWHPTQHPESIMSRIWLSSVADPVNDVTVDLFSGTGTGMRVAKKLEYNNISVERDSYYVSMFNKH